MKRIEILRNEDTSCDNFIVYDPSYAYGNRMLKYKANGDCYTVDIVRAYESRKIGESLLTKYPCFVQEKIKERYDLERKQNLGETIRQINRILLWTTPPIEIDWKNVTIDENSDYEWLLYADTDDVMPFCILRGFYCKVVAVANEGLAARVSTTLRFNMDQMITAGQTLPHCLQDFYVTGQPQGWVNRYNPAKKHHACAVIPANKSCEYESSLCHGIPAQRVFQYEKEGALICADIVDLYQSNNSLDKWLQEAVIKRYTEIHHVYVKQYTSWYNKTYSTANLITAKTYSTDNNDYGVVDLVTDLEFRRWTDKNTDAQFKLVGLYAKVVNPINTKQLHQTFLSDVFYLKGCTYKQLIALHDKLTEAQQKVLVYTEIGSRIGWYCDKYGNEFKLQAGNPIRIRRLNGDTEYVTNANFQDNPHFPLVFIRTKCNGKLDYKTLEYMPNTDRRIPFIDYTSPTTERLRDMVRRSIVECKKDKEKEAKKNQ